MTEFLFNTLRTRWPEILGLVLTITSGFLIPWISKKSGNYKKLNKQMLLICLLHLVYLSTVPLAISMVWVVIIAVVTEVAGIHMGALVTAVSYTIMAIMTVLVFIGVMRVSKRMRIMMAKAREISRRLYTMFQWMAASSIVLAYATSAFVGSEYEALAWRISLAISWALQFWWMSLVAVLVWKASEYVYSKIKVTMMDGEILHFDCSPKVCRVYRSYIRILKRDENDVVIKELQINETAIKQIEYEK